MQTTACEKREMLKFGGTLVLFMFPDWEHGTHGKNP